MYIYIINMWIDISYVYIDLYIYIHIRSYLKKNEQMESKKHHWHETEPIIAHLIK